MRVMPPNDATGTLYYLHSDHLGSTSVTTNASGGAVARQWYYPYGSVRGSVGTLPTQRTFTGQYSDPTGLMYFNARYYSQTLGRFVSADTIVPGAGEPQALNRYAFVLNNPLKYTDPSGHIPLDWLVDGVSVTLSAAQFAADPTWENAGWLALDVVLAVTPYVPAGVGLVRSAARAANVAGDVANTAADAIRYAPEASGHARALQEAIVQGIRGTGDDAVVAFRQRAQGAEIWDGVLPAKPGGVDTVSKGLCGVRRCTDGALYVSDLDAAWGVRNGKGIPDDEFLNPQGGLAEAINRAYGADVITHGTHVNGVRARAHGATADKLSEIVYVYGRNGFIEAGPMRPLLQNYRGFRVK